MKVWPVEGKFIDDLEGSIRLVKLTDSTSELGLSLPEVKELLYIERFLTYGTYAYQGTLILWFTLMLGQFSKLMCSCDKIVQTDQHSVL